MNIYDSIYTIFETYIFGSVAVGSYEELVCIALASCACIFMVALPFVIVYKAIKLISG